MTGTNSLYRMRQRLTVVLAGVFLLAGGVGTALAEEGNGTVDEQAKEVSNNFGELLKGMGQEINKLIDSAKTSDTKSAETEAPKDAKPASEKPK